jgi:DNA polymerase III epsilon subunit-like protein
MKLCFLDLETIPAGEPIDPSTLQPPKSMSKQDTIDKWYKEEAPRIAEEKYRQRALDSMQGQILCIGFAVDEQDILYDFGNDESRLLKMFEEVVRHNAGIYGEPFAYVGWNIKSFDIPWLWRKAIQYDLKTLRRSINRDRYKGNVIDLMEVWGADFKDYNKLSDVAKFLGIPHDDTVTGDMVYDLYLKGEAGLIVNHCIDDVKTVREIYRRIYD